MRDVDSILIFACRCRGSRSIVRSSPHRDHLKRNVWVFYQELNSDLHVVLLLMFPVVQDIGEICMKEEREREK